MLNRGEISRISWNRQREAEEIKHNLKLAKYKPKWAEKSWNLKKKAEKAKNAAINRLREAQKVQIIRKSAKGKKENRNSRKRLKLTEHT